MKKTISLLTAVLIFFAALTVRGSETTKKEAVVEGAIFGGQTDDRIKVEAVFDPGWVTTADNTVYNPGLAQFCALLSADSYFREKDLAKGRQNRVVLSENADKEYEMTDFLTAFGFTETEHYESALVDKEETDADDIVILNIGHKVVDGKYDVYAAVIRGAFGWEEWRSAFDPGCMSEAYEAMTGAHPDWTHGEHHHGIDVAANRALAYMESFMAEHNDSGLPDCLLLTGHSRGGSIANVLGAHFERETDIRPYTYTFNTMAAACADDAAAYKTVFNVLDENDLFTDPFAFGSGAFCRYGTDKALSVSDSAEVRAALARLKEHDDYASLSVGEITEYRRLFAERFPNRDMLCDTVTYTVCYESEELAAAGREGFIALIGSEAGLGVEEFCTVGEVTAQSDGTFCVSVGYCGLALLRAYARILSYGTSNYDGLLQLFAGDETGCAIAALIVENVAGIAAGHRLATTYTLAGMLR